MITIAQFFLDLFTLQYCLGPGLQRDRGNFSKQKSAKSTQSIPVPVHSDTVHPLKPRIIPSLPVSLKLGTQTQCSVQCAVDKFGARIEDIQVNIDILSTRIEGWTKILR